MAQPYVGEIRMFGGNFAPEGFLFCSGQTLNIADYTALYNLIGTTYGENGPGTFMLPDLRGRVPIHMSSVYPLGLTGGAEQVALIENNLPTHTHTVLASDKGGNDAPKGLAWGPGTSDVFHAPSGFMAKMSNLGISVAGQGLPHDNMVPFLCVNFIIATVGIYPSQG